MNITQKVNELKTIIKDSSRIRITTHRNPDGDALGSTLAFAYICEYYNIPYDIIIVDPIPPNLTFLIGDTPIHIFNTEAETHDDIILNEQTSTVVFLDCGQIERAGNMINHILPNQKLVNIDHHMSNPNFGDFNCVEEISSTAELMYQIIKELQIPLTREIAIALYVGVLTDTGCFQYDQVTSQTHLMVSDILAYGVKPEDIHDLIYRSHPEAWLSLLQVALEKLELYDSIALVPLSREDFRKARGFDDIPILLPILGAISTIKMYAILKEKEDGTITVSIRSKDNINIAQVAEHFGGGGHLQAAGCNSKLYSLAEFTQLLKNKMQEVLAETKC